MQKELYKEYALLESEYKRLESKREDLRVRILADMLQSDASKVDTDFGSFTVAKRIRFEYSDAVKKLEEKVKITKGREEKKGVAVRKESKYLLYNDKKII